MSHKDQVAFCGKCRAKRNGAPESTAVASSLPPQYNRAHQGQVLRDNQGNRYEVIPRPELKDESSTSTISSNSSNLQRTTQLVCWTANIATYKLSPTVGKTLSRKSHHQQSAATGHLIIDSGTNVSVMGRTWAVVDDTGKRCKMSGFANDLVKSDIPVCSGKTVVEVDNHKVLLGLHEAPYLKNNEHGLLSTGQAREHGTCVDDTLRCHGGGQRIVGEDNTGTSYNFCTRRHRRAVNLTNAVSNNG